VDGMTAHDLKVLFPNLSDEEAAVAKDNLSRYFVIAWEICSNRCMGGMSPSVPGGAPPSSAKQPDS
jgi:hypothetical protein